MRAEEGEAGNEATVYIRICYTMAAGAWSTGCTPVAVLIGYEGVAQVGLVYVR